MAHGGDCGPTSYGTSSQSEKYAKARRKGSSFPDEEDKMRRDWRLVIGVVIFVATAIAVCLGTYGSGSAERFELLEGGDNPASSDTYCSVFSDPAECEKQRSDGVHKYWTPAEIREELWKTMKGLAELELRENSHYNVCSILFSYPLCRSNVPALPPCMTHPSCLGASCSGLCRIFLSVFTAAFYPCSSLHQHFVYSCITTCTLCLTNAH